MQGRGGVGKGRRLLLTSSFASQKVIFAASSRHGRTVCLRSATAQGLNKSFAATAQRFRLRCLTTSSKACGARSQALASSWASLDSLQKLRRFRHRPRAATCTRNYGLLLKIRRPRGTLRCFCPLKFQPFSGKLAFSIVLSSLI